MALKPAKDVFGVGEVIHCLAKGNPLPELVFNSNPKTELRRSSTLGMMNIVVPEAWLGRDVQLNCTGSNSVTGRSYSASTTLSFTVTGNLRFSNVIL